MMRKKTMRRLLMAMMAVVVLPMAAAGSTAEFMIRGDANGYGDVTVTDIGVIVDMILGNHTTHSGVSTPDGDIGYGGVDTNGSMVPQ